MKKLVTFFLALVMPIMLWAYDFQSGDLCYNITSNVAPYTVEVTSGIDYSGDITIPSSVTYNGITYAVTSIEYYAFYGCSSLTSVTIPNSVTSIGSNAFRNCSSLTSITIPNSVTSIGWSAFEGCSSLTSVTIPNSVTSIESNAFYNTGIFNDNSNWENEVLYISNCLVAAKESLSGTYTIKDGTRIITNYAFWDCSSLTSVTIPNSVTSIGSSAFLGCSSLTSVTIPNSVTSIADGAFDRCSSLTSVTIPSSVTSIGSYAFRDCSSLTSVTIPSSVTSIGHQAFCGCSSLTSVTIPSRVTSIGNSAFEDCSSLTSVTIPNSVTSIGWSAFEGCSSLTSVTIPNSVTSIGGNAFEDCSSLTSVTIPNSVTSIGYFAFYNCSSLTSVTIPNSVTSIGGNTFKHCSSLTSVTIPSSVTSIGSSAFYNCSSLNTIYVEATTPPALWDSTFAETLSPICHIPCGTKAAYEASAWASQVSEFVEECEEGRQIIYTSTDGNIVNPNKTDVFGANIVSNTYENGQGVITFDGPVTSIGASAFSHCFSLNSITIPNSVTSIGIVAFQHCNSLTSVTIGNSVTSIGSSAFSSCSSLTSLTIPNSVTSIIENAFSSCSSLTSIVVEASNTTFDSRENCNAIIETETNTLIAGCQRTIIPNSITRIGDFAFYNCFSLTSITIPNSVINIGNNAFRSCSSLASITIPNSVTSIGQETFCDCSSLTSVTIGNSVKNIGGAAFFNCTKLTSITIPQGVTTIGVSAFHCCSSLASIIVEEGNTTYDSRNNCNAIIETATNTLIVGCQNTIIPNSVTSIVPSAFSWCTSLISIAIPDGVTSIGNNTFYSCFSLASVSIPSSVTSIGNDAFNHCSSLSSITIPNSVTNIGNDAFRSCSSLASITIPNSVTSIGEGTFAGCSSLISVTIGNSVTSIGRLAFYSCSSIDTIHVEATTPPTVDVEAFLSTSISTCYIPCGTLAAYQASDWANYVGEFVETYEYTLILSSSDNSMGSATITQEPACGTPAIIVATPNVGYHFSQWSDGNTDNPRTLTVSQDMELTAQWTPNTNIPYIVKHYRQALDGTYPSALMETENLTGTTATNVTPLVKTYTGFTSPATKTATIAADGPTVVEYYYTRNKYTLTWSTDGDALTGAFSKGSVLFEAAITRPNTPTKTGYTFAGWDNTVPATMPAENLTLTALFTIHTYSVILTADQNGTVSGGGTYNYGESVTITATPNDGYTFSQWSDGNTDNPRTLTVTEDIELTAEFEEEGNYGSYSRTVRIGYNTICLPHGSSHFTGATFYEIAHILKNDKKIFFDEAKTLEAGKPYIFYPHSNEVTIYYDNTTSAVPLSHNGLHGTFDGITAASNFLKGKYLVAGNKMVLCGDGCSLAANRAYIVLDEISDKDHPAIPGIKRVSMDYSEENATTALDNITDESIVAPMQEGVYDILGRKVDAPTVSGFYIINGKKVFVMEK